MAMGGLPDPSVNPRLTVGSGVSAVEKVLEEAGGRVMMVMPRISDPAQPIEYCAARVNMLEADRRVAIRKK